MAKSDIDLGKISALAELQRYGIKYESRGEDEVAICCPVHADEKPSASLNINKNVWRCHSAGCGKTGDIISLIAYTLRKERIEVFKILCERYGLKSKKTISPVAVAEFNAKIGESGPLLKALRDRGVTDEMIRYAKLGYNDGRIIIPVYDIDREIINLRRYLPGAPGPEKMLNVKGHAKPALYQVEDLKYDDVWLVGGEIKALVAGYMLRPKGIGATSVTAGEGAWEHEFTKKFAGKRVFICMDIDAGGKAAAIKLASILIGVTSQVYLINLPLDKEKFPKGDVNDYVGRCGATVTELLLCMQNAVKFEKVTEETVVNEEVIHAKLIDAARSSNMGRTVCTSGIIQAMDETPFILPKTIEVHCTKDQPNCHECNAVYPKEQDGTTGKVKLTINGTAVGLLSMTNSPKSLQREAVREALGIPPCKVAIFTVADHFDVYDVRLAPQLEIGGSNNDHVIQPALIVNKDIDLNVPYVLTGRVYPHPKNQQAVMVINQVAVSKDSLDQFQPTEHDYKAMELFAGPINNRIEAIYTDLETNVTRIYKRRDLHLIMDLTYHSPLYIKFDGVIQRGWANTCIVGDSSQGKSETALRMMSHYGLGERVDCKNATKAGLLGGLNQIGNRWMISWGVIPTHDQRLVVLEEVKGAPLEVLASLTDMRSSGVAEIPKIERRRAHARTRQIWISNPRSDRPVSAYNFGCETIKELIGGLEDVRRFDAAFVASSQQLDPGEINRLIVTRPTAPHIFTSDLCRTLILWCWTRKPEQIQFTKEAERACYARASQLCEKFSDALPLIDKGTTHLKLARLSAGLAGRLFSHLPDDPSVMLITAEHVEYIAAYLDRIYSDPIFGYEDFSRAQRYASEISDPDTVRNHLCQTKHVKDFVNLLLNQDEITVTDICDWCDLERDDAQKLLSLLVRKHALNRIKRWYIKSAGFIELLRVMKTQDLKSAPLKGDEM